MTAPVTTDTTAPVTEQRAPDQDTAVEQAFAAGTLPEEDRRGDVKPLAIRANVDHAAALRDFANRIERGFEVFVHEIEAALHL